MRKGLTVEDLGDLLQLPINATLATYRRDGSVRHIQRAGRAVIVVSDNEFPFRGIELTTEPTIEQLRTWDFADDAVTFGMA